MKIFYDLRRRRVFRLAGLYIIGAWVVIEVASVLFPAWSIPDAALRYLFIAAVLLFPVALVFGWIFDITPDGLVRTRPADEAAPADLSLKRTDYAILVALVAVAVMVVLGSLEQVAREIDETPAATIAEKPANSIAVLPFESLDAGNDAETYADGISEAILHRLAELKSLRVLARTSSFAFRESSRSARELSDILGVRYLLQGTIRREQDRVYLTPILVDELGFEVWSDKYEGSMKQIFELQSRIAGEIAGLVAETDVDATASPAMTTNASAYQHFLVGQEFANDRAPGWQQAAEAAFRRAIAEDPGFAPAHAGLAMVLFIDGGHDTGASARNEEALERAGVAYALAPGLADVQAVMGLVLTRGDEADLQEARQYLEHAIELDPSRSDAYNWLAGVLSRLGLYDEAATIQDRGLAIDPLNPALVTNVADRILGRGDFDRAMALRKRLLDLPQPPGVGLWGIHRQYDQHDDLAESIYWAKQTALAYHGTRNQWAFFTLAELYGQLGMNDESAFWNGLVEQYYPDPVGVLMRACLLAVLTGDTAALAEGLAALDAMGIARNPGLPPGLKGRLGGLYVAAGRNEAAIPLLEAALNLDAPLDEATASAETATLAFALARALHGQGDEARAVQAAERFDQIVAVVRADGIDQDSPSELELLVLQHVLRGDLSSAALALRNALDAGWSNYYWFVNFYIGELADSADLAPLFDEALHTVEEHRRIVMERDAQDNFKERIRITMQEQE